MNFFRGLLIAIGLEVAIVLIVLGSIWLWTR